MCRELPNLIMLEGELVLNIQSAQSTGKKRGGWGGGWEGKRERGGRKRERKQRKEENQEHTGLFLGSIYS